MNYPNNFLNAWTEFKTFVGNDPLVIMLGDREVYKWNFRLIGENRDEELDRMNFIILKPLLEEQHRRYCSGELYKLVGLTADEVSSGGTHDALFDARSMANFCARYIN